MVVPSGAFFSVLLVIGSSGALLVQALQPQPPPPPPRNGALSQCLAKASRALLQAGDLTSDMASKLPNWYSSKEGLTGESPAVFGGCGMALTQAGHSLQGVQGAMTVNTAEPLSSSSSSPTATLAARFKGCACDLASASCALEPIGIGEEMDRAWGALDEMAAGCENAERSEPDDDDALQRIVEAQADLQQALYNAGERFREYGELLSAEDSNQGENSAGKVLSRAGDELERASGAFGMMAPTEIYSSLSQCF